MREVDFSVILPLNIISAGSPNNETSSYERLHARENAAYTQLGVYSPASQTHGDNCLETVMELRFKSQQTDSHTASSNYEVPDNHNGLNIEIQEVDESNAWSSEPITELNVDQEANSTFQISVELQWESDNTNNDSYTDMAFIQGVDPGNNNSYRQVTLVDGVKEWLVVGSFDFNNTVPKNTTLGVAKPVEEMTCRESVGYRCHLAYTKPAPSYDSVTAVVSKRLSVTMRPSLIVSRLYNESINRGEILNGNNSEYVRLKKGQRVMMECDANIGSYNNTAEIHWYRITITTSSRLVYITTSQNSSSLTKKNGTICQYEMTSKLAYKLTGDEMLEAPNNSLNSDKALKTTRLASQAIKLESRDTVQYENLRVPKPDFERSTQYESLVQGGSRYNNVVWTHDSSTTKVQ
ncbi:hypothetical protein MAR_021584 [Mya arenaria]|uniref:Ig-like domain-containing protein n=1 Tax=Mya arenaria TaxID=6604 RepID=A0ABY7E864_MYAAR|nr:hypothetical protein MAR_021584 [Mya arenaria]